MSDLEDNKEFIQGLIEALKRESKRDGYRLLRSVFVRLVELNLRSISIQFSGLFAKTSYLLSEKKAPQQLIKGIGNARQRIRHLEEMSEEEVNKYFLYDLKSVTSFFHLLHPDYKIPEELGSKLPVGTIDGGWEKAATNYLRILVESWNCDYIIGRADKNDSPKVKVCYSSANKYLQFDYSYLTPLLSEGTQLNIIRPRQDDATLYPEMIIFEPDFLIDISSIASGFQEYGVTPLTSLINKISPASKTRAMLLGDFASQLLDEELHGKSNRSYTESVSDFCKMHSLDMATCEGLDNTFHIDAKRQKENIHKAISQDLPNTIHGFDVEEIVLEPSFTCEMLGIQGRMDFLQRDFRLLIEQKSGKGAFVPGDFGFISPQLTTPHYVQLLLYRALIHYNFEMPNEQIRPFLLYSKYERSLLNTESAPELMYRAFKLRNEMVWSELYYDKQGFGILDNLTPDQLNVENTQSKLWTNYSAPDIANTLQPISAASATEKAYYKAMLKFVQHEFILSKIGNKRKENSGFASRWHDSLEEKKEAGNIIDGIKITATSTHIICKDLELGASNFRVGDIVTIYPYKAGTEPDCRKTIVHRASIENISSESITLRLRVPQTNTRVFETQPGYFWAIEHDQMDSSFASQFRGIHTFLSASEQRRSLVLTQRKPEVDRDASLNSDFGAFNEMALRVKQAKEIFLIIGPPGTGKTSFGMLNTLQEEMTNVDASVAVMAFTNRAVDEVCSKLVEAGIDFVRIGSELSCSEEYQSYLLINRVADVVKIDKIKEFISNQKIIVGTTTAFNSHKSIFSLHSFSLAIIDEASQILEPHLLGILSAKTGNKEAIRKFVFIGDHKQLPAVVQQTPEESRVYDPILNEIGLTDCRMSFFERLLSKYKNDPEVVYMLSSQGRMHEDIAAFPNEAFYQGKLSCVPLPHQKEASDTKRVEFIHVPASMTENSDKVNMAEAGVIADIVSGLDPELSVGIIVPYRNQIAVISNAIKQKTKQDKNIIIDTVERFQGSQREVIIFGFTVRHRYQLDFLIENSFIEEGKVIDRKLNVVMTRAMKQLFLVGNADVLSSNTLFRKLIKQYRTL